VRVRTLGRARRALIVVLLAPALMLSACGSDGNAKPKAEPSANLPTGNVEVPDEIELTEAGTGLRFGQPAFIAYQPNTSRSSVISLTVNSVQQGTLADFAAFQIPAATRKSRPYYVRFAIKNVGTGDIGKMGVPLYAVDHTDSLVMPSSFTTRFAKCPSVPLPAPFGPGKTFAGCLVYFIPNGGTLVEMSYRPLQEFPPITWTGPIQPPATAKKAAGKKKAKP
jgi:hypothetical protein